MTKYFEFKKPTINSYLISVILFFLVFGCKKKDSVNPSSPNPTSPPITIADSTFQIIITTKIDINDFDIAYQIKPPQGENFSDVKLYWSTGTNFDLSDSIIISNSVAGLINDKYSLRRLKQTTNYFTRLSLTYKNKKFYSAQKEFRTDTLKLLDFPTSLSREVWSSIKSNFKVSSTTSDTSTRIYLDNVLCPIPFTNGEISQFIPPSTLISKKYSLKFERNGISVQVPDSIEVLKGKWSEISHPIFPLAPGYSENGLGFYGSCYSNQKGYIIGGLYFREIPFGNPNYGRPGHILEFDGATNQWTKKIPTNPMYFENPICHYANNSIYVLGGFLTDIGGGKARIPRMLKFDLNTLTWMILDSLPYTSNINLVSFEFNNEFYVGIGADPNNTCCGGIPLQSKKFWKYNPNTNSWTQLADFPGNHEFNQNYPTAFSIGSKAYVFYGAIPIGDPFNPTSYRQELWEFDPGTNVWAQLNLPSEGGPPLGEKYQIFSYNNKAYFITAQKRTLYSYYYGYSLQTPCLEFDPVNGSFKKISLGNNLDIMKLVFRTGSKFYFQSDALGYIENIPNKTHLLTIE